MSNPIIGSDGNKRWLNSRGQSHRLDGPAFESITGSKVWYVEGKLHRLDGPAVEWSKLDSYKWIPKEWWVDGVMVQESEYPAAVLMYKCKQVLES